ncbi:MAG: tRNA (adenosine(37)-N6)-threonylcarbamoyltransferase complex dimerization subunit type 1 TsaB [Planctomycetota bacterium]|nr:tRNA (adenosine(37)-N6)-threonylcarbamoyltransferase complex dimerization subunit type 1 TsaB [Planctomycetota bacterium]
MTGLAPAVLAMEVSQRNGGVAVRCPDGRVAAHRLTSSTRRGDALMPAIELLLGENGIEPASLSGIGVSIGPGGFTGLRIGIAAAKMLGWALDIPIAGIPTALLAAEADTQAQSPFAVALAGKEDTCWLSLIEGDPGQRRLVEGPGAGQLVDVRSFKSSLENATCLLADEHLPAPMAIPGLPCRQPDFDPTTLLEITERFLAAGEITDPLDLLPIYPRDPEAVRLWDARES